MITLFRPGRYNKLTWYYSSGVIYLNEIWLPLQHRSCQRSNSFTVMDSRGFQVFFLIYYPSLSWLTAYYLINILAFMPRFIQHRCSKHLIVCDTTNISYFSFNVCNSKFILILHERSWSCTDPNTILNTFLLNLVKHYLIFLLLVSVLLPIRYVSSWNYQHSKEPNEQFKWKLPILV